MSIEPFVSHVSDVVLLVRGKKGAEVENRKREGGTRRENPWHT
jgi:hypothetical protein